MSNVSQFKDHDYTIEVHNHHTIRYVEHPDQSYLLILWDKEKYRGNFGGFEKADQAWIAAEALHRGLTFGLNTRDIAIVETNHYHEVKPIE